LETWGVRKTEKKLKKGRYREPIKKLKGPRSGIPIGRCGTKRCEDEKKIQGRGLSRGNKGGIWGEGKAVLHEH